MRSCGARTSLAPMSPPLLPIIRPDLLASASNFELALVITSPSATRAESTEGCADVPKPYARVEPIGFVGVVDDSLLLLLLLLLWIVLD